jgi:hypothetical protein
MKVSKRKLFGTIQIERLGGFTFLNRQGISGEEEISENPGAVRISGLMRRP